MKINQLMLYRAKVEINTNYIITLYRQNVNLVNVKHVGKSDNQ